MLDRVKGIEHDEEDLKQEVDTSSEADQSEENEVEQEGDTSINDAEADVQTEEPDLRAELEKIKRERDNYKEGLLVLKSKKRKLTEDVVADDSEEEPEADEVKTRVQEVLYEQNEKRALKEVITDTSPLYLPELVDDGQYRDIMGYLPRVIDRSSVEGVAKALRIAVNSWKSDHGIPLTSPKKDKSGEIATLKSTPSNKVNDNTKTERKRVIPQKSSYQNWYK